jgi:exonuclease VII large subunit
MDSETFNAMVVAARRVQQERDSLQEQLAERLQQRDSALAHLAVSRTEENRLTTQLQESERLRTEAFQACETMRQQVAELQAQLEAAAVTPAICPQPAEQISGLPDGSMTDFGRVGGWTSADLAFHESRTTQQPDSNTAERLERVRRMIGHVLGWYTCTDWFDEVERAEAWEQVGALLGRLQREAG